MNHPQYHHHHHHHHHHHQDMLKKSFKNTCGCYGCYCCEWNLSPLVQSRIFSVSTLFYFIMIIHTLLVSSGSCNCPFSWIYIQLVSRSSRKQTPHCISKEGECNKTNKCTKKKRKVRKPEVSVGPKARKNDHFCIICLLLLLFLCVYVL